MAGAVVLLDGSHDWLTPAIERGGAIPVGAPRPAVTTRVKADSDCAVVAAASVLAKVRRDRLMIEADPVHPGYHWTGNKGYASADHYAAIDELGPSPLHRWSWLRQPASRHRRLDSSAMDEDEFEDYDREVELALYREYRDVVGQFKYVVETERRFYLANEVNVERRDTEHDFYFELTMNDVWVWDVYRSDRFVKSVRVLTFKDVNVEELGDKDLELPKELALDE